MDKNKAIRFLEVRNIKGSIDDFGGFNVKFETEKGNFSVNTDKLHHPEWYGMVMVNFDDETIKQKALEDEDSVFSHAWTSDQRVIAALALLTSNQEIEEVSMPEPTLEEAQRIYDRLKIPNSPSKDGMLVQIKTLGNAVYLGADGMVMSEKDSEIERMMVDSGMTKEQAEARWARTR